MTVGGPRRDPRARASQSVRLPHAFPRSRRGRLCGPFPVGLYPAGRLARLGPSAPLSIAHKGKHVASVHHSRGIERQIKDHADQAKQQKGHKTSA